MNKFKTLSAVILLAVLVVSCKGKTDQPDPFYVSAVSAGVLDRNSPVVVEFTNSQDISVPLASNAFTINPRIHGALSWQDEYTLVFTPSEPFKSGQRYRVNINIPGVPSFGFEFTAAVPLFNVELDPVRLNSDDDVLISGILKFDSDGEEQISKIEQTVSSRELGRPSWTHENGVHRFSFPSVSRTEASRTVEVTWNGSPLGIKENGFTTVMIPGLDIFQMINLNYANGIIEVAFSKNIKANQDLRGFISLSGNTNVRYSTEGNIVRIFGDTSGGIPAGAELVIQDLEDTEGKRLSVPVQFTIPDNWELPEIRFAGSGVILPTSQGAQLVIETRNVTGIIVEAFHIYNQNMLQFLQVNSLAGDNQLDRVGEPAWTKVFDFEWAAQDQNRWIRRGLDMADLSRRFPGGMFHIRITFRHRHIQYVCTENHGNFTGMEFPDDSLPRIAQSSQRSFWDYYHNNMWSNWREWNNYSSDPCHPAFYVPMGNRNITKSRNIMVSDLGLHAKRALDGSWLITTVNLVTARASPNTEYRVLNYQGRLLHQGRTNSSGIATVPASVDTGNGSRLVIYAESNLGRAYLRVNDSLALAMSHFDIAGGTPTSGIRGLIYGERDVWRPGDDVYLTFLLADPLGTLPTNHPVSFELEDPRGRPVVNRTFTSSVDGFYPIHFSTASDAPTGDWTARVRVGGSTFNRNVKIETIMPNRLKIDLNFGAGNFIKQGAHRIPIESEWLYGAPASGLKADISVSFADKETVFQGFNDYSFRDPSRRVSSERQNVWEGNLDRDGKAVFQMGLNPGTAVPGKVTARFLTRVFEPSGVFSSEQISREYSPYSRYVGIRLPRGDAARNMLLTDVDHRADLVILDEDGRPVQGNVELECAVYKVNWRWWWERGIGEPADFASALSRTPISRQTVTVTNGRASFNFRVNHPEWGRFLVIARDSSGGHAAAQVVYIDWPGWAGRSREDGQGSQTTLALTAGKETYNTGERIQISFPSNREAAALVVLEKGGNIIRSEWINCSEGTTNYEFIADPAMVPNIYAHVTLVQPHLQTQNDLPIRLYGVTPVLIEDTRVTLRPQIRTADNWQAESRVSFTVSEANGRPMAYTVAVVDEGLLGLTRFNIPNPRNTFYARDASFIKSWDLFSEIMGAHSGRLETLLAIGGGDGAETDSLKETQRFKPVVRFFGPFEIGRNGQKTETFELPPYFGAVRIMVLAASSTSEPQTGRALRAYGTAETTVRVTSDLMVFASLPRVLSPGDEVEVPVYVNTQREGNRNVRVNLSVPGAVVQGQASQNVSFDSSGEKLIRFRVKAPDNPGKLQFTVTAESSGLRTARQVVDMDVRSTAIPVTRSMQNLIAPGETWRGNLEYPGRNGTNTLIASFSRLPPLNMEKRLEFLVNYPHGCLEQTVSSAFPQLYLDKVLQLSDSRRTEIRTNINGGIERVLGMQLMSGGFSYWPGETNVNDWSSSYVGHFLLEARKAGYPVRDSALRSWINYQKNTAALWQAGSNRFTEQAYRLYTLALAGEADLGSMNRLRSHRLPLQASWRLAAAYWLAGQRDTARNMVTGLALPQGDYRELSATFGSSLRDKAMILETLILINSPEDMGRTRALFEEITSTLAEDRWLSTQETAYALIALAPYMQANAGSGTLSVDYSAAGRTSNITFDSPVAEFSFGNISGTGTAFTATNRSSSPVYVRYTARGLPAEGSEPALSEGLALTVEYRDSNNRIIAPATLKIGEDMEIIVRIRNSYAQSVEEIALIVPVSASLEIVNTRIGGNGSASNFRYQDIRDDRVMTYFNLNRGEERTIRFRVNRAYEGNFFRPAIHAYAMYDESIRALIPGAR
ncbi:MAG: MG2 domain-containing protein [Treponema sp.]|nr:MG2 domain-containing protein [Treponema sp.]